MKLNGWVQREFAASLGYRREILSQEKQSKWIGTGSVLGTKGPRELPSQPVCRIGLSPSLPYPDAQVILRG